MRFLALVARHPRIAVVLAHAGMVLWLFSGSILEGRVPYFRDLSSQYYPNYVFLEGSLRQGIWPLWHPGVDAGTPILFADPVELFAVVALGAEAALRLLPAFSVLLGMTGVSWLGRQLGLGAWACWTAGAVYGGSGTVLSLVNLQELLHAAAWAPWVIGAFVAMWRDPRPRGVAVLAVFGALQLTTLSAEIVLQTAGTCLLLAPGLPSWRRLGATGAAAAVTLLLSAPAVAGALWLLEGSARAAGFPAEVAFAWSAAPGRLLEAVLPGFLGDVHRIGTTGFWGQGFFFQDMPYLVSLYVGPLVLGLAILAGRETRLWATLAVGLLLALGQHGPLAPLLGAVLSGLRGPVKFVWMADLAISLLAGFGIARCQGSAQRLPGAALAGAGLTLAFTGLLAARGPELVQSIGAGLIAELRDVRALPVIAEQWPRAFWTTGALAVGAGLAVARGAGLAPFAALLAALDLLIVNQAINPTAERSFYELRPEVRAAIEPAAAEGPYRWFSYGFADSLGVRLAPGLDPRASDLWLYYWDRQSLLPRTPVIDGLEGAFDADRTGWGLAGSTLSVQARDPRQFRRIHHRLRMGNVRWVIAFDPLPRDLLAERARVLLPGLAQAMTLYELRHPLPRAFWVPGAVRLASRADVTRRVAATDFDPRRSVVLGPEPGVGDPNPPGVGGAGGVDYERLDPSHVRLRVRGEPGWVVVLDNYHRDWVLEGRGQRRPLERANGTYMALAVPGGEEEFRLTFRPPWVLPAVLASAWGLAVLGWLCRESRPRAGSGRETAESAERRLTLEQGPR